MQLILLRSYWWPVNIPECSFLTVQNLPLHLVSLLINSTRQK